jgi:hypothetical protein
MDPRWIGVGPQPNREDIPRGLREIMNGRFSVKLKFERTPETEGITGTKKPPEEVLRRLVFSLFEGFTLSSPP